MVIWSDECTMIKDESLVLDEIAVEKLLLE
jgi:hypothetical protein